MDAVERCEMSALLDQLVDEVREAQAALTPGPKLVRS